MLWNEKVKKLFKEITSGNLNILSQKMMDAELYVAALGTGALTNVTEDDHSKLLEDSAEIYCLWLYKDLEEGQIQWG